MPLGLTTIIRFYYNYPECEPHGIKNERTRAIIKKLLAKSEVGLNEFPMTCFYELINDVQLSVQERQVCILTRLECSPQNIMIILNLSYSAGVSNVKRKVNMKLFHENNARTLFDNIMSMEREKMSNRDLLV